MKLKLWVKIFIFLLILPVSAFFLWRNFFRETRELEIKYPIVVDLIIDGFRYQTTTNTRKVADFLEEKGLKRYSKDLISPDPDSDIGPLTTVFVTSNKKVSIKVDGEIKEANTIRKTIEKLLKDEGIKLNPFDKVDPGLDELAVNDSSVVVTRIEKKNIIEKQEIEFETITKTDDKVKWKKQTIKQEGSNGLKEVEYEMVYKNGELVSKTKLKTTIVEEAQPKIIVEGRKIEIISDQKGMASWYAFKGGMYCASVKYPRGTWLRVTSRDNGKQVIVQVNDYGPDPGTGKVIDLDKEAFKQLMSLGAGVINVKIEEINSN